MIKEIEELSMNAWPSLQTKLYDGWVMRFSDGYTRRANSVCPVYESTILLDEKIDFCETEYRLRNLPSSFKLTTESEPKGIDARLEERGYVRDNETALRILNLDKYTNQEFHGITIESKLSNTWLAGFFNCSNIKDEKIQVVARKILANIFGPCIFVSKEVDGKIVGCGYGAIERGYVGIFSIVVDENFRGMGYGNDLMNAILRTAVQRNVATAYLQVSVGNMPAEKLYDKIGFTEVYRYWYRELKM